MPTTAVQEPSNGRPRVVIVGGGFGGLEVARGLGRSPVSITLVDRTNHHLFQPLLYQVATAGLSPGDIAAPIRSIVGGQRNTEVIMDEVVGVDVERRVVKLPDREIPYDYLVLATGATDSYFGHDEWEQYAPGLKSIREATAVRTRILDAFEKAEIEPDPDVRNEWLTFVLVGAGPTGVEMSGAIAELSRMGLKSQYKHIDPSAARIVLLEAGPRILPNFAEMLATDAQRKLTRMGVDIHTNARVENIDAEGVIAAGQRIRAKTVIWTAGVAASPAGRWLGSQTDKAGRVEVEENLTVPGHPEIFVIGDTMTLERHGQKLPGVAQVAIQQGRYAARAIRARLDGRPVTRPFRYFDKGNMATVGRSFAIVDSTHLRIAGFVAWLTWLFIHILYLIGFRNRLLVLVQWIWAYITFQRGVRILSPRDHDCSAPNTTMRANANRNHLDGATAVVADRSATALRTAEDEVAPTSASSAASPFPHR